MEINWRVMHDLEQSPLLITLFLPLVLPCEVLVLLWREWRYYRLNADKSWMMEGGFWSGRLYGTQAQEPVAWGAASLVVVAVIEYPSVWVFSYLLAAFAVMVFRDWITESIPILRVMKSHWWS